VSEQEFTDQVLQLAGLYRWRTFHVRPGRTANGWRTPVQGDGKGFPDLLLLRGGRIVVAELKVGTRQTTVEQDDWLAAWEATGAEVFVWRPCNWNQIVEVLK
jgi:hypothetical protein